MKTIAFSLVAGLTVAGSALAGHEMVSHDKVVAPPMASCFRDTELQLDLFGSYTDSMHRSGHGDGFGGGLGVNYFFSRYIGLGVDGNLFEGSVNGLWDVSGRVIARYPIDSCCIAPYIFAGGGIEADGTTVGTIHGGGGLEWRATSTVGIFGEGRYTWGALNSDSAQARLGVRFVF